MKTAKAILIDPRNKSVKEVNITFNAEDSGLDDIRRHLGVEYIDVARIGDRDAVFVDDEGLLNGRGGDEGGFIITTDGGWPHTLAGRGLVVGADEVGETVDTTRTVAGIESRLSWLEPYHFDASKRVAG